jgi:hypothetical protein
VKEGSKAATAKSAETIAKKNESIKRKRKKKR